ncbi:hypothetical protein JL107_04345 [Nakamurella flavida]|uniref:Uncharacterized protein n=1 Tax=Nakamurella flavida TaxID=363630 RepID=A0A938YGU9_9ACTN|nr:hypothetical protein [Nakamurella flavida]MBM9475672.1 hypothetical protein [Nakamurella flavida]MDP9778051.1 hypothetical protein [Nakamurella flavida]
MAATPENPPNPDIPAVQPDRWGDAQAPSGVPRHDLPDHAWTAPAGPDGPGTTAAPSDDPWSAAGAGATRPVGPTGPDAAPVWGAPDPNRRPPAGWRRAAGAVAVAAAVAVVGGVTVATAATAGTTSTERFGGPGGTDGRSRTMPGEDGTLAPVPDAGTGGTGGTGTGGRPPKGGVPGQRPGGAMPGGELPEGVVPGQREDATGTGGSSGGAAGGTDI